MGFPRWLYWVLILYKEVWYLQACCKRTTDDLGKARDIQTHGHNQRPTWMNGIHSSNNTLSSSQTQILSHSQTQSLWWSYDCWAINDGHGRSVLLWRQCQIWTFANAPKLVLLESHHARHWARVYNGSECHSQWSHILYNVPIQWVCFSSFPTDASISYYISHSVIVGNLVTYWHTWCIGELTDC